KMIVAGLLTGAMTTMALATASSGLKAGEAVSPFEPTHVSGPLKGTNSCPPCTYGILPQVQVWVNADNPENVEAIAKLLNDESASKKAAKLQTFLIFVTDGKDASLKERLEKLGQKAGGNV